MKIQERTFFTLEVILIILSAVVSFGMTFIPAHAYVLTDIELVLYVLILGLNFVRVKAFNLYQVWVASYIFIIWSEMCILTNRGRWPMPSCCWATCSIIGSTLWCGSGRPSRPAAGSCW